MVNFLIQFYWMLGMRLQIYTHTHIRRPEHQLLQSTNCSRAAAAATATDNKKQNTNSPNTLRKLFDSFHFLLKIKLEEFKRPTLMIGNIFLLELTTYFLAEADYL